MFPKVTIIILNWNGWEDTIECLDSLYQNNYFNYNIILVDNNSSDESIDQIKRYTNTKIKEDKIKFSEFSLEELKLFKGYLNSYLILVKNDKNYGFAEGNNIGIRFSLKNLDSEYILLLNNDTIVDLNFLKEIVKVAESDENIAISGPKIYPYIEKEVLKKSSIIGMKIYLGLGGLTKPVRDEGSNISVDSVSGACMLIKSNIFYKIGLLDDAYFFGWEDVDICTNARKLGFRVVGVPNSKICHKIGASYGKYFADNPNILTEGIKNQLIFLSKYGSDIQKITSIIFIPLYYIFIIFYKSKNLNQIITRSKSIKKGIILFFSYKKFL